MVRETATENEVNFASTNAHLLCNCSNVIMFMGITERMERKVNFIGVLANVDKTILQLTLENGFYIEPMKYEHLVSLLASIEKIDERDVFSLLTFSGASNIRSMFHGFYVIRRSFTVTSEMNIDLVHAEQNRLFNEYLTPMIKKLRLFKDGNIFIALANHYETQDGVPCRVFGWSRRVLPSHSVPYSLSAEELPQLTEFLKSVKFPLTPSFIDLAHRNLEISYEYPDGGLSFLSSMMSLEVLFNPSDKSELRYRISRGVAVFLGSSVQECRAIMKEVRSLYDLRSDVVHSGDSSKIELDKIRLAQQYAHACIKKAYLLQKEKKELHTILDASGFGVWLEES